MIRNKPLRVLQATVANDKGGLTGVICKNYEHIDKHKIQYDFLTYDDYLDFEKSFVEEGAVFHHLPRGSKIYKYYISMKQIQVKMNYKIIHFNLSYCNLFLILIAKLVGIEYVVIHSHSTRIDDGSGLTRGLKYLYHNFTKMFLPLFVDEYFACSKEAAKWMFPKSIFEKNQYKVIKNAIDLDMFVFNKEVRRKVREEFGINDVDYCIGHVGRFTYQKNHDFLIDVFAQLVKECPNSRLLLVGDGPLVGRIKDKIASLGITEKVLFLGVRDDVYRIMQAMDVFVLPSRFEGLPVVGIEAQATGMPCIFCSTITREVGITSNVRFLDYDFGVNTWATEILKFKNIERLQTDKELQEAGYDICTEVKKIENQYLDMYKE